MKPDGTRHGKATKWYDNGQKESEIELKDWMKHGKWTFWNKADKTITCPDKRPPP